ncbi:hypothetical protein ACODM8_13205 [Vibrio ostreicida]|uniref:Uncharacterized protein n=1 Tax=Vibrio ostreicida TaxID=526588 RepID=A0ABT8BWA1_9VIBR|nr:hypothetical protein [Vibrio ostreicida]MDN3610933.1 hypothetical protein [Vibrio ostreicida]NPD10513.1 hypothetical protein [Vibrio ostreicida]
MKTILSLLLTLFASSSLATALPELPSKYKGSPHKIFLSSESNHQDFDTWKIDGGYSYNIFSNIDVYVGARLDQGKDINESGIMSGVSYQITPRVSVKSTLHAYADDLAADKDDNVVSAEVSSRMRLTENLDFHATLEHQEWQQELEFGIGFRF